MRHKIVCTILALILATPILFASPAAPHIQVAPEVALHKQRAEQYLRERRPDLAIPELQALIALDPENVEAHGNLGVLLFFRGDYKGAVPQLRYAVKAQPNLWKLRALLGLGEGRFGDSTASREDLAVAFPHLNSEKLRREVGEKLIGEYTANQELERAAGIVSTLLAAQPTDASLLYLSYRLYSDMADRSMLTLALAAPASAEMHQVMARELARQGESAAAIANYREAIELNPILPDLHTELGYLLFRSDDPNMRLKAGAEFKTALASNPRDARAQFLLGKFEARQGDTRAAQASFTRALQLDPYNADACVELAKIEITMSRRKAARTMLERAVQIDPTEDVAHYLLATTYRQEGRTEEARTQVALYLKYKRMKDEMEKVFQDMRVLTSQREHVDSVGKLQ